MQYDVSLLNEAPPTEYAQEYAHVSGASEESLRRAANEDLADSMALYVWAPEILKERAPLRYAFLDYVAKGGDPITFSFVNKVGEVVQIKQEFQFLIQSSIAPIGFIFGTLFKLVDAFGVMLYRAQLFAGLINRYRMKNSQQAIKKLASQQKVIQRNLEAVLSRYKYQQQTWNTRVALSPKQFGNSIEYVRYWYQALKSLDKVIIQQYRLKQFHEISPSNVNKIQPAQLIKQYWQKKGHDWQLRVGQIAESNRRYQQGLVSGALGANAVEPDSLFDQAIGFWSKALLDALKGSIRYIFSQNTSQEVKRMPAPETILQNPFLKWATPFFARFGLGVVMTPVENQPVPLPTGFGEFKVEKRNDHEYTVSAKGSMAKITKSETDQSLRITPISGMLFINEVQHSAPQSTAGNTVDIAYPLVAGDSIRIGTDPIAHLVGLDTDGGFTFLAKTVNTVIPPPSKIESIQKKFVEMETNFKDMEQLNVQESSRGIEVLKKIETQLGQDFSTITLILSLHSRGKSWIYTDSEINQIVDAFLTSMYKKYRVNLFIQHNDIYIEALKSGSIDSLIARYMNEKLTDPLFDIVKQRWQELQSDRHRDKASPSMQGSRLSLGFPVLNTVFLSTVINTFENIVNQYVAPWFVPWVAPLWTNIPGVPYWTNQIITHPMETWELLRIQL